MAKQLFGNNASSLLAASISDSDLSIQVQTGFGVNFPLPGVDEYFLATLENEAGDIEIVKVDERVSDLLNIPVGGRGQDGTSAQAWTNGQTRVELRLTKGTMETFIQRGGDVMEGDLNMDGNELQDAQLTGTNTQFLEGEIVNVPLRGAAGDSSNEILVPTDGTRATAGGLRILAEDDNQLVRQAAYEVGMIFDWWGLAVDCPDGFAICDGTGGTPDMRGRVALGVSGTYTLNAIGGAASASPTTSSSGGHDHGGSTGATALTEDQIPEHHHRLFCWESAGSDPNPDGWNRAGSRGIPSEDAGPFGYREESNSGDQLVENAGGGGATHDHTIAAQAAHTHTVTVATLPPYRALHKIMYTGVFA